MTARNAALVGAAGLALAGFACLLDPAAFAFAWVAALSTWLAWPIGSMALLLIHALTGGRWGDAIAPGLRLGVANLKLLLPALLPVLLLLSGRCIRGRTAPAPRISAAGSTSTCRSRPGVPGGLPGELVRRWPGCADARAACLPAWRACRADPARGDVHLRDHRPRRCRWIPTFNSSIYGLIALAGAGLVALAAGDHCWPRCQRGGGRCCRTWASCCSGRWCSGSISTSCSC